MITVPTYFGVFYKSGGSGVLSILSINTQINSRNGTFKTNHRVSSSIAPTMLVLTTANENDTGTYTITSKPPLTWVKALSPIAGSSGRTDLWWANFTSSGNIDVTSSFTGGNDAASSTLYVITGSETVPLGYSASVTSQTAPFLPFTSSKAGSIVIMSVSDWGAVSSSTTFRGAPVTSSLFHYLAGAYTGYHWRKSFPTINSSQMGISSPNIMNRANMCLMEIRPA